MGAVARTTTPTAGPPLKVVSDFDPAGDQPKAIRQLAEGRTALIIAHRFTTAMQADIIHVMERGEIIESGDKAAAQAQLVATQKLIDKAAKQSILHANNASNQKAKLARRVNAM